MKTLVMNVDEAIKKCVSEKRVTYRLLSEKTKGFLSSILSSKGIVPHAITSREKDPKELRKKGNPIPCSKKICVSRWIIGDCR